MADENETNVAISHKRQKNKDKFLPWRKKDHGAKRKRLDGAERKPLDQKMEEVLVEWTYNRRKKHFSFTMRRQKRITVKTV